MKLVRDPRSFQAPLDEAWAASVRAAIAAGVVVHGAEARIRAALDERDDRHRQPIEAVHRPGGRS